MAEPYTVSAENFADILGLCFAEKSCAPPGAVTREGRVLTFRTAHGQVFEAYVYQAAEGTLDLPLDSAQVSELGY